jgi:Rad51
MGTRHTTEPLQSKIWQLAQDESSVQGYLYSCSLDDEPLVLSEPFINSRKVQLAFSNICPGCGFELEKTLRVQTSTLPVGRRLLTNPDCKDPEQLIEPGESFEAKLSRGSTLLQDVRSDLTTGMELLDETLVLRFGQLLTLQGEASNALSHLLCVRAIHPLPPGLDSDVVFVDGGNVFDAYTVSRHAFSLELDQERTKLRIHLSRVFTHHQLSSFITERLAHAIDQCDARLAIVSDITALYCDPDVKEKREAFDLFSKDIRYMATLAEQRNMIIVVTNLQSRSKPMDDVLARTAHVSATLHDKGVHTQLTVTRHPFIQTGDAEIATLDNQTLTRYLQKPPSGKTTHATQNR